MESYVTKPVFSGAWFSKELILISVTNSDADVRKLAAKEYRKNITEEMNEKTLFRRKVSLKTAIRRNKIEKAELIRNRDAFIRILDKIKILAIAPSSGW